MSTYFVFVAINCTVFTGFYSIGSTPVSGTTVKAIRYSSGGFFVLTRKQAH